ncbi:lymphocyte antigen 75-like, partial [Huso huso]
TSHRPNIPFFSGICAVASGHFRKYHFVKDEKSWFDAQSYCREKHTDLATIESQEETEKVLNISAGFNDAWIGLYYDKENWQWSNGDNVSYYNWTSSLNCTSVDSKGEWVDSDCNNVKYYFICYNDASCTKYHFVKTAMNWSAAQTHCRDKYTDLATVHNQEEVKQLSDNLNTSTNAWIGMYRDVSENWQWSNGDEVTYNTRHGRKLFLVTENKTWEEAVEYCRSNHTDLVSIGSKQELQRVYREANKASSSHVWLGLLQSCTFGFWYWVDGTQSCYDNWAPEPRCQSGCNQCGVMTARNGSKWTEKPCTERFNFICYNGKWPGFVF